MNITSLVFCLWLVGAGTAFVAPFFINGSTDVQLHYFRKYLFNYTIVVVLTAIPYIFYVSSSIRNIYLRVLVRWASVALLLYASVFVLSRTVHDIVIGEMINTLHTTGSKRHFHDNMSKMYLVPRILEKGDALLSMYISVFALVIYGNSIYAVGHLVYHFSNGR